MRILHEQSEISRLHEGKNGLIFGKFLYCVLSFRWNIFDNMAKKMRHFGRWAGLFSQLLLCVRAMSIVISPPKWPVMPFPIEYLLTSEVTLKSKLLSSTRLRAQLRALKCKHLCWQLLLTFHLEDNKSYFRKCGKNRWQCWKVSCAKRNLQSFEDFASP